MSAQHQLPIVDIDYQIQFLTGLLNTPSPTGMTEQAVTYTLQAIKGFPGVKISANRKGGLLLSWDGKDNSAPRALTAHLDTLGAMVKEIKPNGRLKLTQLGGYPWNTIEGEGCTVFTNDGKKIRGSILHSKASAHVYGAEVRESKRDEDTMEVRLDERTSSNEDTEKLGITVGDFVAFDPRVEVTNGFIRSRHLDDKACVANIVSAIKSIADAGLQPSQTTTILFSNYEEVGHGAAVGIPAEAEELVCVDMAAVGNGQTSDEFHTTLCVKDSGGPYHHGLSQKLRKLGDQFDIPYKVDIYPYYGSDGEAFWRAGGDVAVALIGPGVDASHNYERTHSDALLATTNWLMAYLLSE
ncbi:MAG: M42 family metallopeptidase [Anaerolineales bacterium]|nr:M42 family metallopeptidase [Anaerolineales bacterium]